MPPADSAFLQKYFVYYRNLGEENQERFRMRLDRFREDKHFSGRGEQTVNEAVEIFVSAFAIQLTFGLKNYLLPHFREIIIYPRGFRRGQEGPYHRGEVHIDGAVVFSFHDLVDGQSDARDGYNLGLHEFAHALIFENYKTNQDYFFLDQGVMNDWRKRAREVILEMRNGVPQPLRDYASANFMEFFAVCAESFFERPKAFQESLPELYDLHTRLLKQDPANGQYRL